MFSDGNTTYFSVTAEGVLTVAQRVDREMVETLTVTVTVTDSASHTDSVSLDFNINDINDNIPICDQDVYFVSVEEGTADGRWRSSDEPESNVLYKLLL